MGKSDEHIDHIYRYKITYLIAELNSMYIK